MAARKQEAKLLISRQSTSTCSSQEVESQHACQGEGPRMRCHPQGHTLPHILVPLLAVTLLSALRTWELPKPIGFGFPHRKESALGQKV